MADGVSCWLRRMQPAEGPRNEGTESRTVMCGRSCRMARPLALACMRTRMPSSALSPVVSPSAATRSARAGLRMHSKGMEALCGERALQEVCPFPASCSWSSRTAQNLVN